MLPTGRGWRRRQTACSTTAPPARPPRKWRLPTRRSRRLGSAKWWQRLRPTSCRRGAATWRPT
eukprot:jgi/Mesen1/209/ME1139337C07683